MIRTEITAAKTKDEALSQIASIAQRLSVEHARSLRRRVEAHTEADREFHATAARNLVEAQMQLVSLELFVHNLGDEDG